jgi:cephalosporin hydroxylase
MKNMINKIKSLEEIINFIHGDEFDKLSNNQLVHEISTFGLNDEVTEEQPIHLSEYFGKGIRMWQYPIQLAPYIKWLRTLNVKSYCEIGVRWGGNFITTSEILIKNNPNVKLYACDMIEKSDILLNYDNYTEYEYLHYGSNTSQFKSFVHNNHIEMVFIDGDHSYEGCLSDYKLFENNLNTKYIVFHDISHTGLGVIRVWNEVKNDSRFDHFEFTEQYPDEQKKSTGSFLGFGILVRK